MNYISVAIHSAFALLVVYIAYNVYTQYRANSALAGWERWRATARGSAVLLWGKFSLVIAGLVANLDTIFNALGAPQVSDAINKTINPQTAAVLIAIFTIAPMLFRLRTLKSD